MRLQEFPGQRRWNTAVTLYAPAWSPSRSEGLISASTYVGLHVSTVCALSLVLEKGEVMVAAGQGGEDFLLGEGCAYLLHKDLVVLHLKVMLQLGWKVQGHVDRKSLPTRVIYL